MSNYKKFATIAKQVMQEELTKAGRSPHDTFTANYETKKYQLARLIFTGCTINDVENFYHEWRISQEVFEAYCWLWRNSSKHLGSFKEQYENSPIPDNCYDLVEPYFSLIPLSGFIQSN